MYDELVRRLRDNEHEIDCSLCDRDCCYPDGKFHGKCIIIEAADAIEELQKAVNFHKFNSEFWEGKYNSLADEKWIPVAERLPSDFVSVQAHMTDAGNFPPVREAYVVNKNWFFPALKEFHPVDMWRRFDEPPKEE